MGILFIWDIGNLMFVSPPCRTIDGIPQYDRYPDPVLTDCGAQMSGAIGPCILDAITKARGATATATAAGTPSNKSTAGKGRTTRPPNGTASGGSISTGRPPSPPMPVIMPLELIRSMETALFSFPGLDVHPIPNVATDLNHPEPATV